VETTAQLTLMDHLSELRGRLLCTVGVFLVGAVLGFLLRVDIIHYLQSPLHQSLYYTTPTGSFEFVMQVSGLIGLIAALPVLVYNLLRFLEPALPKRLTKGLLGLVVGLSFTLAMAGVAFAYYVSLPTALHFFGSVGSSTLMPLISIEQYFRFVFAYLMTFAVVFQLPLLILLLDHVTPLSPGGLRKARKFVIAGAFGIALIMPSAPDPVSQIILALPIILLYEVSLAVVWARSLRRRPGKALAATSAVIDSGSIPRPKSNPDAVVEHTRRRPPVSVLDLRNVQPAVTAPRYSANIVDLRKLA